MWHPSERIGQVENRANDLPLPHEGIDEVDVPSNRHEAIVHAVRVLEVNLAVPNVLS